MPIIPLSSLKRGDTAIIASVTERDEKWNRRLEDLGFTPGTVVTTLRKAPFGGPTVYRVRSYELSLRKSEADSIFVNARSTNG